MPKTTANIAPKRGRPAMGKKKKNKFLSAAVNSEEFDEFSKACAKAKQSQSDYIRARCLP